MSRSGALRVFAPSLFVFVLSIAGLLLGSYWQYVLAIDLGRRDRHRARDDRSMRCITMTGAMRLSALMALLCRWCVDAIPCCIAVRHARGRRG
jgi:hypothetical protein